VPAETHQRQEPAGPDAVLELLGNLLDLDLDGDVASVELIDVGMDDDLGLYSLWDAITGELAERTVGELDVDDARVSTLGDLARVFAAALRQTRSD
jgi:hypothetical protein